MTSYFPFGSLPPSATTDKYAFALSSTPSGKVLSLENKKSLPHDAQTDIAKVREFVLNHLDQLPQKSWFILSQINSQIAQHNENNSRNIELLPTAKEIIAQEISVFCSKNEINSSIQADLIRQLQQTPDLSNHDMSSIIKRSPLTNQQQNSLLEYLKPQPTLETLPDDVLRHIFKDIPLASSGISRSMQRLVDDSFLQRTLLQNLERLKPWWPQFNENTNDKKKIELIKQQIQFLLPDAELRAVLKSSVFHGSVAEIEKIREALQQIEDEATVALYHAIKIQPPLPMLRGRTLSVRALQARTWLNNPQNLQTIRSIQTVDLTSKRLFVIPKEIEKFDALTVLTLDDNGIISLKGINFPASITEIRLWRNRITSLEGVSWPTDLRKLYIEDNFLFSLLGVPPNLQSLYASKNRLTYVDPLPSSLTYLAIDENPIREIRRSQLPRGLKRINCGKIPLIRS